MINVTTSWFTFFCCSAHLIWVYFELGSEASSDWKASAETGKATDPNSWPLPPRATCNQPTLDCNQTKLAEKSPEGLTGPYSIKVVFFLNKNLYFPSAETLTLAVLWIFIAFHKERDEALISSSRCLPAAV